MKNWIVALLLLLPMSTEGSQQSRVYSVYNKLVRANHVRKLPIYVKSGILSTCSLACTDGHQIIVSTELLSYVKNDDELAGVIGHEMGHALYREELKADIVGLHYAKKAGYGYCKAAQFLKGLKGDREHPEGNIRYKNTGCP